MSLIGCFILRLLDCSIGVLLNRLLVFRFRLGWLIDFSLAFRSGFFIGLLLLPFGLFVDLHGFGLLIIIGLGTLH